MSAQGPPSGLLDCYGLRRFLVLGILVCLADPLPPAIADEPDIDTSGVRRAAAALVDTNHQYYRDAVLVDGADMLWLAPESENSRTVFALRRIAGDGSCVTELATWEHPYPAVLHSELVRREEGYLACAVGQLVEREFFDISCWMLQPDGTGPVEHVQVVSGDAMTSFRVEPGPAGRTIIAYRRVIGYPYSESVEPMAMVLDEDLNRVAEASLILGEGDGRYWLGDLDIGVNGDWISLATVYSRWTEEPGRTSFVCLTVIDSKAPDSPAARACKPVNPNFRSQGGSVWVVRDDRQLVAVRHVADTGNESARTEFVKQAATFTEEDFGALFETILSSFPSARLTPYFELIRAPSADQ